MFPEYTRKERLCDGVIHLIGAGASVLASGALVFAVLPARDGDTLLAAAVYGAGLVAMFGASAAYNLTTRPDLKENIRRYDHAAIFLMIGGTYTPFALIGIGGEPGHVLLALVWPVAAFGVWLKLFRPRRFERGSVILYLALGWAGLAKAGAVVAALPTPTLVLVGIGGVFYTIGVVFHLWEKLPYHNAVWHAFVLTAASCHYAAVFDLLARART